MERYKIRTGVEKRRKSIDIGGQGKFYDEVTTS